MHSHHSHSGDYVAHASDTLEGMVAKAESMGYLIFCLTEHMPRVDSKYMYPEELEMGYGIEQLNSKFQSYLVHAKRLQDEFVAAGKKTKLLIGFEVEGLDLPHIELAKTIVSENSGIINMSIGSVHFVHGIPIDFSAQLWKQAESVSGSPRQLFKDYFELQHLVVSQLQPEVIGHFDLIRLFLPQDEIDPSTGKKLKDIDLQKDWPDVWLIVERNVDYIVSYGGLFELNSAAIRKGWSSPYPKVDIARFIDSRGGKFCLSDDSHSLAQVGLNYHKVWAYIKEELKLQSIYHLDLVDGKTVVVEKSVESLDNDDFWKQYNI